MGIRVRRPSRVMIPIPESRSPTPQDMIFSLQRRIQELEMENRELRAGTGKRSRDTSSVPPPSSSLRLRSTEDLGDDPEETHSICHHEKVRRSRRRPRA